MSHLLSLLPLVAFLALAIGCGGSSADSGRSSTSPPQSSPTQMDSSGQSVSQNKATFDASEFTTAPRRVVAAATLNASPEDVWEYVSNHDNLVAYSGGSLSHASVDRDQAKEHNGVGTQRHCEMPDGSKFAETIVFFRAPKLFAYSLEANNSWGLSDHLGVVRVEPTGAGSRLTFELYFNHPKTDMMVKNITGLITMRMLPHFTEKFGGEVDGA